MRKRNKNNNTKNSTADQIILQMHGKRKKKNIKFVIIWYARKNIYIYLYIYLLYISFLKKLFQESKK